MEATITSVEILTTSNREAADRIIERLAENLAHSYLKPTFGAAPHQGQFHVFAQSADDRAPEELLPTLLASLAHDVGAGR